MVKDIQPILNGWEFKPNKISVRKIKGADGSMKLQLRLDLGLLQMELTGRPDGAKPYGYESLLEYYEVLLRDYKVKFNSDEGFSLDSESCSELQRECIQYYHRYLSLFQLREFQAVVRDTQRNLRVFDMIKKYAAEEIDIWNFEQFRPYVIMMNVRAKVHISLQLKNHHLALKQISDGIDVIRKFFDEYGQGHLTDSSREVIFLENWLKEIQENRPLSALEKLQRQMERAVENEEYEKAAILRDRINDLRSATDIEQ